MSGCTALDTKREKFAKLSAAPACFLKNRHSRFKTNARLASDDLDGVTLFSTNPAIEESVHMQGIEAQSGCSALTGICTNAQ